MTEGIAESVENIIRWANARAQRVRTVIVARVHAVTRQADREQDADAEPAIADLEGGEAAPIAISPSAPVLAIARGGYYLLMPVAVDDESVGLVCDRALGTYRATRKVGEADPVNGARAHDLSDVMLTPLALRAPSGAPETWSGAVLGGPSGPAIEIAEDGTVAVTGQATAGTNSTIEMTPDGNVRVTVGVGNSVEIGGAGAVELAKGQATIDAIDAMLGAGTPIANDGGENLLLTMTTAWNIVKNTIKTTKAKGE